MKASENQGDGNESEPRKENVRNRVREDGSRAVGAALVIAGGLSETNAAEGTVYTALWKIGNEILNENKVFVDVVWRDEEMLCETEKRDGLENRSSRVEAGKVGLSDEDVGKF